jgi:hypothetical protein
MIVAFDTEFLENGRTIDMISIGMVAEDGQEYYAISNEFDEEAVWEHSWLPQHVMVHLPLVDNSDDLSHPWLDRAHKDVKPRSVIRTEVHTFLKSKATLANPLELWGYFSSYDHIVLCQLFGTMMDLPRFVPMYTNDVMQEFVNTGAPREAYPDKPHDLHNALADAQWTLKFVNNVNAAKGQAQHQRHGSL